MPTLKSFHMATDKGPYLPVNGDMVGADPEHGLYLLIDGIGGGHKSLKAASLVKEVVQKNYTNIAGDPDATLPFYYTPKYLIETNAAVNASYHAHNAVLESNRDKKTNDMASASGIIVCQSGSIIGIVSTGNCCAYLCRGDKTKKLAEPDTLADLCFGGTQSHLYTAPMGGFGLFDDFHFRVREHRLCEGDSVVLLSDGLYARIDENEILSAVVGGQNGVSRIEDMFRLANGRGNLDNQSCIILNY